MQSYVAKKTRIMQLFMCVCVLRMLPAHFRMSLHIIIHKSNFKLNTSATKITSKQKKRSNQAGEKSKQEFPNREQRGSEGGRKPSEWNICMNFCTALAVNEYSKIFTAASRKNIVTATTKTEQQQATAKRQCAAEA